MHNAVNMPAVSQNQAAKQHRSAAQGSEVSNPSEALLSLNLQQLR
jgi:hypothetical protein